MEKLKQHKYIISLLLLVVVISFIYNSKNSEEEGSIKTEPNIEEVENNNNDDFETYQSKLGFSFQYPSQFFVMEDPEPSIPERLYILIKGEEENPSGIIISTTKNTDNQTPLEWLEGQYSGADLSNGYDVIEIDDQKAIMLDNGMWIVINTPDNKYQLSFATLPGKNGELLYLGTNTITSSFKFDR